MSIITPSTALLYGTFQIQQQRFDLVEMAEATGDTKTRLVAPPRWKLRIGPPQSAVSFDQLGLWVPMLMRLRGGVNHLAVHDIIREVPFGTVRGPGVLAAPVADGASTASLNFGPGQAGRTFVAGDWLQIGTGLGSHYCMVVEPLTLNGSGVGTATFEPPTRKSYPAGDPLTVEKALGYYKMTSNTPDWSYASGGLYANSFSAEFLEHWT